MKKFKTFLQKEDAVPGGGTPPTNNVGDGALAGMGVHGAANQEPGISKKRKNKSPVIFPDMMRRSMPNNVKEGMYDIVKPTVDNIKGAYNDAKAGNYASAASKVGTEVVRQGVYAHPSLGVKAAAMTLGASPANAGENELERQKKFQKEDLDTFMGSVVFEVDSNTFHNVKWNKRKHKHWRKYLGEDDSLQMIREYAKKNPTKPIIIRNKLTSEMCFVKYGNKER